MSETFGSRDWCLWCKSTSMAKAREFAFAEKPGGPAETVYVCSEACERELDTAMKMVQKGKPIFLWSLLVMVLMTILGIGLGMAVAYHLMAVMAVGIVGFGLVTPQTILMLGMRKGLSVGRVLGVVLVLMGIGTALLPFFTQPK